MDVFRDGNSLDEDLADTREAATLHARLGGGAFTFGSTDNLMLSRAVNLACQYTANNR